jgi:hypothetical protein
LGQWQNNKWRPDRRLSPEEESVESTLAGHLAIETQLLTPGPGSLPRWEERTLAMLFGILMLTSWDNQDSGPIVRMVPIWAR